MYEDRKTIGLLENSWNDLDVLNSNTACCIPPALDPAVESRSAHRLCAG